MKKLFKCSAIALSALLVAGGLTACGKDDGGGGSLGDNGEYRPSGNGETTITFWGHGDDNETGVFQELVKQFNEKYKGQIKVNYEVKAADTYSDDARTALRQTKASVDILYVGDSDFKRYAGLGYLEPLDDYLKTSKEVVLENMWETSVNRFKYDVNTTTQDGPDAHYWGIPKDIGPTVIYYNETYFNNAGVNVISVAKEDLKAFNDGGKDSRGKTKEEYGIAGDVQEKGYFIDGTQRWFNNQIPMSWEETVALSQHVQTEIRTQTGRNNVYGYFTEWWFNYGWSVGGDCIEYVATDDAAYNGGYWDFTLMDPTKNYIVADDNAEGITINDVHYNAGEIISWQDKLVDTKSSNKTIRPELTQAAASGKVNELPSQREAFVEFVRIGTDASVAVETGMNGYGICPTPTSLGGDAGKTAAFAKGDLAMLVDGRWNVVNFRKQMDDVYNWDVAPLPQYKTYYTASDTLPAGKKVGDVKVHGIEAGHSGSVALSINAKSKKKVEAWIFAEYIGGETGQTAQSLSGFAIPSQKDLAMDKEIFLQPTQNPKNSIVFVRAAQYETPGDWWYLKDKAWIDDWAGLLNGDVRNGKLTLTDFEKNVKYTRTWDLLKEYTKKN